MDNLKIDFSQNSVFFGDRKIVLEEFKNKLKNEFIFEYENFSFYEIEKQIISVYDVRKAIEFANRTSEGKKIILLSSFYWKSESQNALLKVLEETPSNTFIFLFGHNKKTFLPTILSRTQKFNLESFNRFTKDARAVLALNQNSRLDTKQVKKILSLKVVDHNFEKDTENEKKDREAHILFLYAIIDTLLKEKESLKLSKEFIEKMQLAMDMAETEGGSPHLFIDWLLLASPVLTKD
jgi:DNA polymerase III delta prime subunit